MKRYTTVERMSQGSDEWIAVLTTAVTTDEDEAKLAYFDARALVRAAFDLKNASGLRGVAIRIRLVVIEEHTQVGCVLGAVAAQDGDSATIPGRAV